MTQSARSRTLRVRFSDACTDVLAFLADKPVGNLYTIGGVADAISPPDAYDTRQTASSAMRTLLECGLVEPGQVEGIVMWRATEAGRKAVADARLSGGDDPEIGDATQSSSEVAPADPYVNRHKGQVRR